MKKLLLCAMAFGVVGFGTAHAENPYPIQVARSIVQQAEEVQVQQLDMWSHLKHKVFGGKRKDDNNDRNRYERRVDHRYDRNDRGHRPPPPPPPPRR